MSAPFKHISLWRLRVDAASDKRRIQLELQSAVARLQHQIPGLRSIELGIDVGGPGDRSDVALYSEFESAQDVSLYLGHPAHLELVSLLDLYRVETRVVDYFAPTQW